MKELYFTKPTRFEAIAPSLVGWRRSLLGWRTNYAWCRLLQFSMNGVEIGSVLLVQIDLSDNHLSIGMDAMQICRTFPS